MKQREEQKAFLLKQMEEKKARKADAKAIDVHHDKVRLAVTEQVHRNQNEFILRNMAVAQKNMDENLELDRMRKEREVAKKAAERAQDLEELAFTRATELKYTAASSNADKLLK